MKRPDYIPEAYDRLAAVDSLSCFFNEIAAARADNFARANVILFPRRLEGDFDGLAKFLASRRRTGSVDYLTDDRLEIHLQNKSLTNGERMALETIIADMRAITEKFPVKIKLVDAVLRVISAYNVASVNGRRGLDVCDFHADGQTRICAAYNAPVTEWLRDEDAVAAAPDRASDSVRGSVFAANPGAVVQAFRAGDIWCHAGGQPYAGRFIHRAPQSHAGQPRLLMVVNLS